MDSANQRLDNLLESLKEEKTAKLYTNILLVLLVILMIGMVGYYILYGFHWFLLLYLMVFCFTFIFFRVRLVGKLRDLADIGDYSPLLEIDHKQYLTQKLRYAKLGVDIKKTRISVTRMLYIIVFPIVLVLLGELLIGQVSGLSNLLWRYLLAFCVGGLVWFFAFSKDLREIGDYEDQLIIIGRSI